MIPVIGVPTHRWTIKAIHQILFDTEDEDFDQGQIKPCVYKIREVRSNAVSSPVPSAEVSS
jgi:hypothetical protein